jgi:hypothetical protein
LKGLLVSEEYSELGVLEAIGSFENSMSVTVAIGDWKINAKIKIEKLKELILNDKL